MINTREEAREYFKKKGLSYSWIKEFEIEKLRFLIEKELLEYLKDGGEHAKKMDMKLSNKFKKSYYGPIWNKDKTLKFACITVNGSYFKNREGICFNDDGFIGFCGWADNSNKMPFINIIIIQI